MAGSRQDAKQSEVSEAPLVAKLIRFPADWVERVDEVRGEQSFSDFVRLAVLSQIDNGTLSDSPQWGQGRPRIITVEEVAAEIRRVTEHELNRHQKQKKRSA
jgi:hypothetical protein